MPSSADDAWVRGRNEAIVSLEKKVLKGWFSWHSEVQSWVLAAFWGFLNVESIWFFRYRKYLFL